MSASDGMVVAHVFHVLLFECISSASSLVLQTILPLMVTFSAVLSLKACGSRDLGFSCLYFILIKTLIFSQWIFCIFFVIIKVGFPPFEFVFCLSYLGLSELEVLLAISLCRDICGLRATCYMLSMNQKLPSIVMISNTVL